MSVTPRRILLSASDHSAAGTCMAPVLRMAIGLACSYRRPKVTIVLHGDAVRCARTSANPEWTRRYQVSAGIHSIEVLIEKESLQARGLELSDLLPMIKLISGAELAEQWQLADVQVRI
jgi:hypothetical protein